MKKVFAVFIALSFATPAHAGTFSGFSAFLDSGFLLFCWKRLNPQVSGLTQDFENLGRSQRALVNGKALEFIHGGTRFYPSSITHSQNIRLVLSQGNKGTSIRFLSLEEEEGMPKIVIRILYPDAKRSYSVFTDTTAAKRSAKEIFDQAADEIRLIDPYFWMAYDYDHRFSATGVEVSHWVQLGDHDVESVGRFIGAVYDAFARALDIPK